MCSLYDFAGYFNTTRSIDFNVRLTIISKINEISFVLRSSLSYLLAVDFVL
jgi:hypothetical protein